MEFCFLGTPLLECKWILLPVLSVGVFQVTRLSISFLMWIYACFLRSPSNLLEYGRWAIVTGPTDGIGKAMAFQLGKQGLNLILVGRSPDKLKLVSSSIQTALPKLKVVTVVFDLAADIPEGVRRLKLAIEKLDVGVLVNNAGLCYDIPKYFHDLEEKLCADLVKVNIEAMTEITRAVLPGMMRQKKGVIVFLGSGSVDTLPSYPLFAVYAATKGFVGSFTRSLHREYKKHGIVIQCQIPGYIVTKMVPDKKANFFNTTPEDYVPWAVRAIGYGNVVHPYWRHSLQRYIVRLPPDSVVSAYLLQNAHARRKNILALRGKV